MAGSLTERMAQFYEQCQEKGYTDMHDDVQSLKAKVIATDLSLNYGKIDEFYKKAERAFEQVKAEREIAEKERAAEEKRQQELAKKRAVNGELLVTMLSAQGDPGLRVYIRPDRSIYTTINNGAKIEETPQIKALKGGVVETTYHPSQAVYTGATVGGITTGGVHQTKASISDRYRNTGTGYIEATVNDQTITVVQAVFSEKVRDAFKRDKTFRSLTDNSGMMTCMKSAGSASTYMRASQYASDIGTRMTMQSMAVDEMRLPYSTCQSMADLLRRAASASFPPSDQEIYDRARRLAESEDSQDIRRAIEQFESISDYRDAKDRAEQYRPRFAEQLQKEKEQAVLEKERRQDESRKNRKQMLIGIAAAAVLIAIALLITNVILPKVWYSKAVSLMEAEEYEKAVVLLERLNGAKDSADLLATARSKAEAKQEEEERLADYEDAAEKLEQGDYVGAAWLYSVLGDYKDSKEQLRRTYDAANEDALKLIEQGKYEDAAEVYESLRRDFENLSYVDYLNDGITYIDARKALQKQQYAEAYKMLRTLGDFNGADELLKSDEHLIEAHNDMMTQFQTVGAVVEFGTFDPNSNPIEDNVDPAEWNGAPIEWIVVDVQDGKSLLLSKYSLFYLESDPENTINHRDYLKLMFNKAERKAIMNTALDYEQDSKTVTRNRYLFSLTAEEAALYLPNKEDRLCSPVAGARKYESDSTDPAPWWLRQVQDEYKSTIVDDDGRIIQDYESQYTLYCRPAMWVNHAALEHAI